MCEQENCRVTRSSINKQQQISFFDSGNAAERNLFLIVFKHVSETIFRLLKIDDGSNY